MKVLLVVILTNIVVKILIEYEDVFTVGGSSTSI